MWQNSVEFPPKRMKEIQTPQKMYGSSAEKHRNRRLKHIPNSDLSTKKRLSAAFSSVSEDSSNFSPISKISDANHNEDVTTLSLDEISTDNLLPSDTMSSKKITDGSSTSSVLTDCYNSFATESALFSYVNAEFAENSPTRVQPQVHDWIIADPRYRKLVDEITKHVMEEICGRIEPEDSNRVDELLHAKNRMVLLSLCIWIIVVLALFFFIPDIHCPPSGQVPT